MQDIKPLPDTGIDNWQKASLDELRTEVQNLRHWCGQLFLQVKEWTTRSNDLQQTAEQRIKLDSDEGNKYIDVSNKTNNIERNVFLLEKDIEQINDDIRLIMESLGLSEGEQSE